MRLLTYHGLSLTRRREAFERVREAIERDDLRAADVKKLHVGPYYRAKLGYADRLLLQFLRAGDETVCVALEVIEGHAYERSRFLRGAPVDEAKIEQEPPHEVLPVRTPFVHPRRPTIHFLDKPVSFDDAQDAILRHPAPLILVGTAGSGKTVLTLEKLRQMPGAVAYVTQSAYLAETARGLYFSHGFEADGQDADFLSYRELLESIEVPSGRAVTFPDFRAWFERHKTQYRFADAHQVFEELRGVLSARPEGPLSREAYLGLGVRQSIFGTAERQAVFGLFEKYRAWLLEAKLFDTNLVAHERLASASPRYDFVVVDEVQDLTAVELSLVLRLLKKKGAFLLAGDANQIVHPNFFSWSGVKTLLWNDPELEGAQAVSILDVNYRSASSVTRAANGLLKIKHARFGSVDKESNDLIRAASPEEGAVVGVESAPRALSTLDEQTRRSTHFAVVVLRDEDKAEARKHFRTPLLFSVHEAKGLEYENVILFHLVSRERAAYQEVCAGVSPADLEVDALQFRRSKDKSDKSLEIYKFFVNALYVALTRAVRRVYVVESDPAHPMLALLGVRFGESAPVAAAASSIEDWQKEARRLELQGKREQAEAIRKDILREAPVPWKVLDAEGVREVTQKALAPNSVSNKAKQTLFEYACFHALDRLAQRLEREARFAPAKDYERQVVAARRRSVSPYESKNVKEVLWQTERYGVDFRTIMNETPLALAAAAGNVPLASALLERGASRTTVDHFGRMPVTWAVLRAYEDASFAHGPFAELYERLAPPSLDVQVSGRLFKIGREKGEYFLLLATWALFKRLFRSRFGRYQGLASAVVMDGAFQDFPHSVVTETRKRRTYINQVFARNEPGSSYEPNRQLWVRERQGQYAPNPAVSVRVRHGGEDVFRPLHEVLGVALLDEHRLPPARPDAADPRALASRPGSVHNGAP